MLPYHPAFDIYHCAYRILLLLEKVNTSTIEVERVRIWDFYFVFPQEAKNIRITQSLWSLKKEFLREPNPYEKLLYPQRIFERMEPFQIAALKYLAAYGFIDSEELANKLIKRTEKAIPETLLSYMDLRVLGRQEHGVLNLLSSPFNDIKLFGPAGFKDRTKLLDFKYDPS